MCSLEGFKSEVDFIDDYVLHGCNATLLAERRGEPEKARTFQRWAKRFAHLIPDHYQSEFFDELRLEGDGIVAPDWHLPLTNYELLMRMCEFADKHGLTGYLSVPGDALNQDATSQYNPKQADAGLDLEFRMANKTFGCVLDVFDTVALSAGNHDRRFAAQLGFKIRFDNAMKMILHQIPPDKLERLKVVGNDHMMIDTDNGEWRACHTASYSKNPLTVPRELCDIHSTHVIGAHRHHAAIGYSKGGYIAVEGGGLFDKDKTAYLRKDSTTFPHWQNDFVVLRGGFPTLPVLSGLVKA